MLSLNILSIKEYQPVHRQKVTIFKADKSWLPIMSIVPKFMQCEVHFQMYDAEDGCPVPTSCCFDPETQSDIPFDTPIRFISEPIPGNNKVYKIVGWEPVTKEGMESLKYHEIEEERFYYKKQFYFTDGRHDQIDQSDQYNEVLGIIDTQHVNDQLMRGPKPCNQTQQK